MAIIEIIIHRPDDSLVAELRADLPSGSAILGEAQLSIDIDYLHSLSADPAAYGAALTAMVFPGTLREAWILARGTGQVHLRIVIGDPSGALHALRWELLRDPLTDAALAQREGDSLARQVLLDRADELDVAVPPPRSALRALVAVAGPRDYERYGLSPVDVPAETQRALAALGDIPATLLAEAPALATLANITARLREGAQLLYLVCHGRQTAQGTTLFLVGDENTAAPISGAALEAAIKGLEPRRRPILTVLVACESASQESAPLASVGPLLARAGVPAVLAMQAPISMAAAAKLTTRLLRELARDGRIAPALAAARKELGGEWWVPALWLRVKEGLLWGDETSSPTALIGWQFPQVYPMPPNFTGRDLERATLSAWLAHESSTRVLVLRALGGFGKSALAWYWLNNDVDQIRWPRVLWWNFEESDADSFLREAAKVAGADPHTLGLSQMVEALLCHLTQPGTLLVLDAFERELRAFAGLGAAYHGDDVGTAAPDSNERDCIHEPISQLLRKLCAMPGIQAKILVTTRLRPSAIEAHGGSLLQGCREIEISQLQLNDAVTFMRREGIAGTDAEIEEVCDRCGCHPLSLRLLTGMIVNDFELPGDIAAARHLDLSTGQGELLAESYRRLNPTQRLLLSRLACLRGPADFALLRTLAPEAKSLDVDVRVLVERGLLRRDLGAKQFNLHAIVQTYAYDQLAGDERQRTHTRLSDYFDAIPRNTSIKRLEDLAPRIELYHHLVRAGQLQHAFWLYQWELSDALYYGFGAYQACVDLLTALLPYDDTSADHLLEPASHILLSTLLGNSYFLSGRTGEAMPHMESAIRLAEHNGLKDSLANACSNLGILQIEIGALRAAETNLQRSIEIGHDIDSMIIIAHSEREMGRLLRLCGNMAGAASALDRALDAAQKTRRPLDLAWAWVYRAHHALLTGDLNTAQEAVRETQRFADTITMVRVRACWMAGLLARLTGDVETANQQLNEALKHCRRSNDGLTEPGILLDLAVLRRMTGHDAEARELVNETLMMAERCHLIIPTADAHLLLAYIAQADGDDKALREHAHTARLWATCDDLPDYTYRTVYETAGVLLAPIDEAGSNT